MYFIEGSAAIGLRVGTCVAYAIVVMGLLWLDKTELLGILLGIVMCGMVGILPLIYWLLITIITILWRHIYHVLNTFICIVQVGLFFVVVARMNLLSIKGWVH